MNTDNLGKSDNLWPLNDDERDSWGSPREQQGATSSTDPRQKQAYDDRGFSIDDYDLQEGQRGYEEGGDFEDLSGPQMEQGNSVVGGMMSVGGGMEGYIDDWESQELSSPPHASFPGLDGSEKGENSPLHKRHRTSTSSHRGQATGFHHGHADESEEGALVPLTSASQPPLTHEEQQLEGLPPYSYEEQRILNIKRNTAMLQALGLTKVKTYSGKGPTTSKSTYRAIRDAVWEAPRRSSRLGLDYDDKEEGKKKKGNYDEESDASLESSSEEGSSVSYESSEEEALEGGSRVPRPHPKEKKKKAQGKKEKKTLGSDEHISEEDVQDIIDRVQVAGFVRSDISTIYVANLQDTRDGVKGPVVCPDNDHLENNDGEYIVIHFAERLHGLKCPAFHKGCSYYASNKEALKAHIEACHNGDHEYWCGEGACLFSSNSNRSVGQHRSSVHGGRFQCPHCPFTFRELRIMMRHFIIGHGFKWPGSAWLYPNGLPDANGDVRPPSNNNYAEVALIPLPAADYNNDVNDDTTLAASMVQGARDEDDDAPVYEDGDDSHSVPEGQYIHPSSDESAAAASEDETSNTPIPVHDGEAAGDIAPETLEEGDRIITQEEFDRLSEISDEEKEKIKFAMALCIIQQNYIPCDMPPEYARANSLGPSGESWEEYLATAKRESEKMIKDMNMKFPPKPSYALPPEVPRPILDPNHAYSRSIFSMNAMIRKLTVDGCLLLSSIPDRPRLPDPHFNAYVRTSDPTYIMLLNVMNDTIVHLTAAAKRRQHRKKSIEDLESEFYDEMKRFMCHHIVNITKGELFENLMKNFILLCCHVFATLREKDGECQIIILSHIVSDIVLFLAQHPFNDDNLQKYCQKLSYKLWIELMAFVRVSVSHLTIQEYEEKFPTGRDIILEGPTPPEETQARQVKHMLNLYWVLHAATAIVQNETFNAVARDLFEEVGADVFGDLLITVGGDRHPFTINGLVSIAPLVKREVYNILNFFGIHENWRNE